MACCGKHTSLSWGKRHSLIELLRHVCGWGYALSPGVSRTLAAPPTLTLNLNPVSPQVQCCSTVRAQRLLRTPSLRSEFQYRQRKGPWKALPFTKVAYFHRFTHILPVNTPVIHREPSFLDEQSAFCSKECYSPQASSILAVGATKTRTSLLCLCLGPPASSISPQRTDETAILSRNASHHGTAAFENIRGTPRFEKPTHIPKAKGKRKE